MKTRSMLIGIAMAAALNCTAVNAQVVGGLGGGLGGGLSGGLRDMNMTTQGTLNGSLGADVDTGSLSRTTRDTAERTTNRARNTTSAVRDRAATTVDQTREKAGETRQAATATTSAAAATAVGAVKDVQIEGAADMAGSATSNVSSDGINLAGTAQGAGSGAVNGATLPQPELSNVAPAKLASGDTANVSNATQHVAEPAKDAAPAAQPSKEDSSSGLLGTSRVESAQESRTGGSASGLLGASSANGSSTTNSGVVDAPKTTTASDSSQPTRGLNIAGDANGSASASRSGASAEGGGSVSASRK